MNFPVPRDARRVSAFLIVPLVLVVADMASNRTSFKFLLLPPFAALTYVVFVNPAKVEPNALRVIATPTLTGALALLTLLLHTQVRGQIGYVISVFLFTPGAYAIYRAWLLLPLERWPAPASDQSAT